MFRLVTKVARKSLVAGSAVVLACTGLVASTSSATAAGCARSSMYVVAHADDTLLFLSPDLLDDIHSGACVTTVYLTAGDQGLDASYWAAREQGTNAAYADMAGLPNDWTRSVTTVAGHQVSTARLNGSNITQIFFRLPDGNTDGNGFAADHNESLLKLWRGGITASHPVDGAAAFTAQSLRDALTDL